MVLSQQQCDEQQHRWQKVANGAEGGDCLPRNVANIPDALSVLTNSSQLGEAGEIMGSTDLERLNPMIHLEDTLHVPPVQGRIPELVENPTRGQLLDKKGAVL